MVVDITNHVKLDNATTIAIVPEKKTKKIATVEEMSCPKCKEGIIIKGKSAHGCSRHKEGCDFIIPFSFLGKNLTNKQLSDLILKGKTTKIKGFVVPGSETTKDGKLFLTGDYNIELEE